MRGALALGLLGTTLASANTSRRLQAGSCADLDGDGTVNVNGAQHPPRPRRLCTALGFELGSPLTAAAVLHADLLQLLASYSQDTGGDVNSDGTTNVEDLLLLLAGVRAAAPLFSAFSRV